jgi:phosphoribosylaminoimidazolecarboxamide formyltransferase/IMP cyclohydrolase
LDTVRFFNLTDENRSNRKFIEVVVAPKVEPGALAYLQNHKNLRVLEYNPALLPQQPDYRLVNGTLLEQDYDNQLYEKLEKLTEQNFDMDVELIEFGLKAIKNIKSNAIVIVGKNDDNFYLMGMGAGQPNRLVATELALSKARDFIKRDFDGKGDFEKFYQEKIARAYLISDAFFPFADNVELAAEKGIKNIVQPGGSIRDKSVIETCNNLNVNMIFTGIRHFKH